MPTIKTKKEMNIHQLIEWVVKEDLKDVNFYSKHGGSRMKINFQGRIFLWDTSLDDVFVVEIVEEITEDTKLEELFLITNDSLSSEKYYNYSINEVLSNNEGYYEEQAMLILKPEPLIIWTKEKGLIS